MNTTFAWLCLACGSFFATASSLLMRLGGENLSFTNGLAYFFQNGKLWLLGLILGWLAGLGYAVALTRLPISSAAVVYVPVVYLAILICGVLLLHENLTFSKKIGICLISAGLFFCAKG